MNDPIQWLQLLNTVGFPLLLIYAHFRGWIVTPRELGTLQRSYDELKARYDRLEAQVDAEKAQLRQELEETRTLLIRVLTGELRPALVPTPGGRASDAHATN